MPDETSAAPSGGPRPPLVVRVLAAGAVLAFAGTFLAERIDYGRRHIAAQDGTLISGARYWPPQLVAIWLPGLAATALLAAAAAWSWRRHRRAGAR